MKKILCFLSLFLIITTVSCTTQMPKTNISKKNATVTTTSLKQISDSKNSTSSKSSNEIAQAKSFVKIDMVAINSGYAITKDFHVVKTSDGGNSWADILTISNISDDSAGSAYSTDFPDIALFALDDKAVYVASFTANNGIVFEKSIDAGKSWSKSVLKIQKDSSGNSVYGGTLVLSFINKSEGFLLLSAMPACGLMSKVLYRTTDGGNNWSLASKSLNSEQANTMTEIHGYTTGMAFSDADTGYITCTYHGQTEISLYKTTDSGKSWSVASFPLPKEYHSSVYEKNYYVDAYPPVFFGEGNKNAKMVLYFCHDDARHAYIYSSHDGGSTWCIDGISNMLMKTYCFVDNQNGFGLDENGTLYATKNGGVTWLAVP